MDGEEDWSLVFLAFFLAFKLHFLFLAPSALRFWDYKLLQLLAIYIPRGYWRQIYIFYLKSEISMFSYQLLD